MQPFLKVTFYLDALRIFTYFCCRMETSTSQKDEATMKAFLGSTYLDLIEHRKAAYLFLT